MQSTQQYNKQLPGSLDCSYEALYRKYYPALVFFANRLVLEKQEAEDIVTEVFIRLWHRFNGSNTEQQIKAFLYISTRNACLNVLQQRKYQGRVKKEIQYVQEEYESEAEAIAAVARAEALRELAALIELLPPKCRAIMRLRFSLGLMPEEIAKQVSISKHTVRNQLVRGVELTRRRMKEKKRGGH